MSHNTAQVSSIGLRKATLFVLLVILMVFFGIQATYVAPSHNGDILSLNTLDANVIDSIEESIPEISSPFCYWMCSIMR